MAQIKRIVLVGHCGADQWALKTAANRIVPDVEVTSADDQAELDKLATPDSLLLINRVLHPGYSTGRGVELIAQLLGGDAPPRAMLISDYADAQSEAEAAGAAPGFGKSELHDDKAAQRLQAAVGQE